ncbi:transmembrane protein [Achlya hypogyna]|uniref:Transmembrane protein n=1 Tax=Achlya hypogyna TaxID=1202772 RepID=A0A1V9ZF98_ACHHY|nr:transmembrane protein [Achlya hypogyna]
MEPGDRSLDDRASSAHSVNVSDDHRVDLSSVTQEWEHHSKESLVDLQGISEDVTPPLLTSYVRAETQRADSGRKVTSWRKRPILRSLVLAVPWVGLTLLNCTVFELLTSFLTSLGVAKFIPRYLPPFYTFFVAPLIGGHSDRSYSKWGRRNGTMLVATCLIVVSVLLFGGSQHVFGDHLVFHILNVVVLIHGSVTMELVLRTRLFDEIPRGYQVHAQACGSIWHSVGVAIGMLILGGGTEVVYGDEINRANLFQTCCIVAAVVTVTVAISIYLMPEKPQDISTRRITTVGHMVSEIWDTLVSAPYELRLLCVLQLFLWMAWSSFDNQKFKWWGSNVYAGCPTLSSSTSSEPCTQAQVDNYVAGLNEANSAVQGISASELIATLGFMLLTPANPSSTRLHRLTYGFMFFGVVMFAVAVIVGSASHTVSFVSFVCVGTFYSAIYIFPYAVTGVIAKDLMDAPRKFNNNGIYAALLMQFIYAGQFVVEEYNASSLSSLGSSNTMALPVLLFILSFLFMFNFKFEL